MAATRFHSTFVKQQLIIIYLKELSSTCSTKRIHYSEIRRKVLQYLPSMKKEVKEEILKEVRAEMNEKFEKMKK
jgi:BMFP domain-containing protein YqiC